MDPGRVMAELFGKATGVSGGRGGSMHLFDTETRLLGGYGIVGGQIPPATGAALALTYRGEPGPDAEAVMCLLGDGTTNIGAFHESLNLAALWQLPIVYVIVNNRLGMGTPVEKAVGRAGAVQAGLLLPHPGRAGRRRRRRSPSATPRGPRWTGPAPSTGRRCLLEAVSYRLQGPLGGRPGAYRSREETERLRAPGPGARLPGTAARRRRARRGGGAAHRRRRRRARSTAAVAFADESPDPPVDQLFDYAYATPVRQRAARRCPATRSSGSA